MHKLNEKAMVLRAARASVREHTPRDPLMDDCDWDDPLEVKWRLEYMQMRRESPPAGAIGCRSVAEVAADAEVLGFARDADHGGGLRSNDEIVVRTRYTRKQYLADYGVTPDADGTAICWQD